MCVCERESEGESVCVCAYVCVRERVCVRVFVCIHVCGNQIWPAMDQRFHLCNIIQSKLFLLPHHNYICGT